VGKGASSRRAHRYHEIAEGMMVGTLAPLPRGKLCPPYKLASCHKPSRKPRARSAQKKRRADEPRGADPNPASDL
jgi:hypothetical protein